VKRAIRALLCRQFGHRWRDVPPPGVVDRARVCRWCGLNERSWVVREG
jgi:hypothetical protein